MDVSDFRFYHSTKTFIGNSGSPVFDRNMNLIGINNQMVVDTNNSWLRTVGVPIDVIMNDIG